jgi:hypothetical protein
MLEEVLGKVGSNARGGLTEDGDLMLQEVLRKIGWLGYAG